MSERGFSLIEILVAFTLIGISMLALLKLQAVSLYHMVQISHNYFVNTEKENWQENDLNIAKCKKQFAAPNYKIYQCKKIIDNNKIITKNILINEY